MPAPKAIWRLDHEARSSRPARWLEKVSNAWDEFQASRARDTVYGYLEAVFGIVDHYRTRRRTNKLLRHAFEFADQPLDKNADPFTAVIRCTCNGQADNKTISKWARALRYAGLRAPAERQGPRPGRTPAPRFVCQARFLAGRGRADWSNRDSLRAAVRKLGKEAEGRVESGTIFRHVEFSFVRSRSPPRKGGGRVANLGAWRCGASSNASSLIPVANR